MYAGKLEVALYALETLEGVQRRILCILELLELVRCVLL